MYLFSATMQDGEIKLSRRTRYFNSQFIYNKYTKQLEQGKINGGH